MTDCKTVEECGALADHYMDIAMVFWWISLSFALLSILLSILKGVCEVVEDWQATRPRREQTRGPHGLYVPGTRR